MKNSSAIAQGRIVAIIIEGRWLKGYGHEVCFAVEGEQGYACSGVRGGSPAPWYWGDPDDEAKSFEKAKKSAESYNEKRGISKDDTMMIVAGTMQGSSSVNPAVKRERKEMEKAVPEYAGCIPYRSLFSLFDYVLTGQGPGGFLEAFLANDLNKALTKADGDWTLEQLRALTTYIYNHLPDECWKCQAKVEAWKKAGGKFGQGWVK